MNLREVTDRKRFRQVLGQYPTGVCVITAAPGSGGPVGITVGSFTSVSLDPPLVAFLPDRGSTAWARIREAGRFCVNILSAQQESVCRRFATRAPDKFDGISHRPAASGAPILDGAVAWMDCELQAVHEAGDHDIVVGLVRALEVESGELPLLFFQGGYGRFSPLSLGASDPLGAITEQLRRADVARPEMERLCADLSARCIATARVSDEIVIAASAGVSRRSVVSTLVGLRLPFIPPSGAPFLAWAPKAEVEKWLEAGPPELREPTLASLRAIRERGFSVGLLNEAQREFASTVDRLMANEPVKPGVDLREVMLRMHYDPPEMSTDALKRVRLISAPVFDRSGQVALMLTLFEFPKPTGDVGVRSYIHRLLESAERVTERFGGAQPTI
ncbi:flavin reductase [Ramlibacter sp.]|uniref:flavin reductase n=1 Tax=Ramlibacter sp. TaxID=1917967 RepID=UPI003D0B7176